MQASSFRLAGAALAFAAVLAACSDSATSNSSGGSSAIDPRLSNLTLSAGQLGVCKFSVIPGSDPFTTNLSDDPTSGTVRVLANGVQVGSDSVVGWLTSDNQCRIYTLPGGTTTLDVTETPTAGSALYFYRYLINGGVQDPYANIVAGGPTPNAYTIHREGIDVANTYEIWLKNVTFTPPPPGGCTYTLGYWKTHSKYGPAPKRDAGWDNAGANGEDTIFFLSGASWYQVFQVAPQGNIYYILSQQYMAAKLNILGGDSSTPEVDAAITAAETFFNTYTPVTALSISKQARAQLAAYAATLDQYNNGLIGPGHCSDEVLAK